MAKAIFCLVGGNKKSSAPGQKKDGDVIIWSRWKQGDLGRNNVVVYIMTKCNEFDPASFHL